ncbi:MAG: ATP-binding protein [Verrucomicrobia bacterium]|nr:ATP-binding protein [Verrucomicrobiota bacterium]
MKPRGPRSFEAWAGGLTALAGAAVLAGWVFDLTPLKSVLAGLPSMKVNAAIGFVLSGAVWWVLGTGGTSVRARWVAGVCAGLMLALSGLTLAEHLGGGNFGIDEVFVHDLDPNTAAAPGRMAALTAFAFLLINAAALLRLPGAAGRRRLGAACVLSTLTALIGVFGVAAHVVAIFLSRTWSNLTTAAVHAGALFILLGAVGAVHTWKALDLRWVVRGRLSVGLTLAALATFGTNIFAYASTQWNEQIKRERQRIAGFINLVEKSQSDVRDLQAVLRGFLLTREAAYLEARGFAARDAQIERDLTTLAQWTARSPGQTDHIATLSTGLRELLALARETARQGRGGDFAAGTGPAGLARSDARLDDVVRLVDRIIAQERERLTALSLQSAQLDRLAKFLLPAIMVADATLLLFVLLFLNLEMLERQRAEAGVRALNLELEQRVAARTAALETAHRELESFSYSISHDLRAPLRHISGYVDMLSTELGATLAPEPRRHLNVIASASVEMGQLIDDLLAFSRLARTEQQRERVDLDKLVAEAIGRLELATKDRPVEWHVAALPAVIADRALLRQVWANLLGNAVKFTRGRTPARIEIGVAGEEAGRVVLCVRDNGAGFDMRYADKLFGVFRRLHRAEEFEGTGIGLATVRQIVNRHGGRVWAEARPNEGAAFYFALPAKKS